MNINQIRTNQTLLHILFGQKTKKTTVSTKTDRSKRDTVTISDIGREQSIKPVSGRTRNTSIDDSIDLKAYIADARKTNREIIENAGTEIDTKPGEYVSTMLALRAALTDKYERLVAEAKTHADPERFIAAKYFDQGSVYYETDLSDAERSVGYQNEMWMYRTGHTFGVDMQDSLFRGIAIYGDVEEKDEIQFKRQLVNAQISNILKGAGIQPDSLGDNCTFSVDPYNYYITVEGVDVDTKATMENALNVGKNGKNLFRHIHYCATRDGCNSSQVNKVSYMKYQAYHQVYNYTGYKLDSLDEKDGTFYTKSGENILDLVDSAVENSEEVPDDYKAQTRNWIHELVLGVAARGWGNIPDMRLSILFTLNGLQDLNQSIIYQYGAENALREWYSVM